MESVPLKIRHENTSESPRHSSVLLADLAGSLLLAAVALRAQSVAKTAWTGASMAAVTEVSIMGNTWSSSPPSPRPPPPLFVFYLPLSHNPVPVNTLGLRSVKAVTQAALTELALPVKLGRALSAADVRIFVISREEALRLVADDARVVPQKERGAPLDELDGFNSSTLSEGSCLLLELRTLPSPVPVGSPSPLGSEAVSPTTNSPAVSVAPVKARWAPSRAPAQLPLLPMVLPTFSPTFPRPGLEVGRVVVLAIYVLPLLEMMDLHVASFVKNLRHPLVYSPDDESKIASHSEFLATRFSTMIIFTFHVL